MSDIESGKEEGRKEGIKEGREEGREERTIEVAKEMKKNKISMELIEKITGLTKEMIKNVV